MTQQYAYIVRSSLREDPPLRETDSLIAALGAFWKAAALIREIGSDDIVELYRGEDDIPIACYDRDGEAYYGLRYDEFRLLSPRRRERLIYHLIGEFKAEVKNNPDVTRYDLSAEQAQAWAAGTRVNWEALVWEIGPACYQFERLAH